MSCNCEALDPHTTFLINTSPTVSGRQQSGAASWNQRHQSQRFCTTCTQAYSLTTPGCHTELFCQTREAVLCGSTLSAILLKLSCWHKKPQKKSIFKLTHAHACKIKADYVSEFSALVTLGGMQAKHNPQPEEQLIDLCQQAIDWCWICVNVCNGDG